MVQYFCQQPLDFCSWLPLISMVKAAKDGIYKLASSVDFQNVFLCTSIEGRSHDVTVIDLGDEDNVGIRRV